MKLLIHTGKKLYCYSVFMIFSLILSLSGSVNLYNLTHAESNFSVDKVRNGRFYYLDVQMNDLMQKKDEEGFSALRGRVGYGDNHMYMYRSSGEKQYIGMIVPENNTNEFSDKLASGEAGSWLVKVKKDKYGHVRAGKHDFIKCLSNPTESCFNKVVEQKLLLQVTSYDEERFVSQQKIMLFPIAVILFFLFFVRRTD
ncbi:MAG: hypothetical protein IJO65_05120 [Lachnospiraceae bacterium]|nr:hypothetical protein [Lachnospiraceae bacterium]